MFSIFTYIMSRVTHSEPGLPMLKGALFCVKLVSRQNVSLFEEDQRALILQR